MNEQPTVLLTHKVPTIAFDNIVINTKTDGQTDILFYQLTSEGNPSEADVRAAIRVQTVSKLKEIQQLLGQAIRVQETKEP